MSKPEEFPPAPEQPFVGHLIEMRDRLMKAVVVIIVVFLCLFPFANDLYTYLADPLLKHMPEGTNMLATDVISPFLTPFKLALVLAIFITVPYSMYQLWGFVAPALYSNEKRLVFPLLFSSTFLFYLGMAFAYYVVFPLVFGFVSGIAPDRVDVAPDISRYLDFVLKMFFAFGLAFEVPIATILLIWSGVTTAESLAAKRPYIVVGAFVVGMLLTPPDVISQTLLAVPMWILFEAGLFFSRMYTKPKKDDEEEDNEEENAITPASAGVTPTPETPTVATVNAQGLETIEEDTSPGQADHYSESDEEQNELSDDEMEAELDKLDADEGEGWETSQDNKDKQVHEEFEPIEEERASDTATKPEPEEKSNPEEKPESGEKPDTNTDTKKDS